MERVLVGVIRFFARMLRLYQRCAVGQAAAALAYFLILTLFPLLLLGNSLIGLFHADLERVLVSLHAFLPQAVLPLLRDYLRYSGAVHSGGVLLAALSAILFSASAGLRTLLETLDRLYGRKPKRGLKRIFESVVLSLLLLLTVYLSVLVLFTGEWFFQMLENWFHWGPLAALSGVWLGLRYVVLFAMMLLLVLLIYWLGCPKAARGSGMVCSALVTAWALSAGSAGFSWVIGMSARYSLVYGSLASLIVMLVWLYFCGHVLLLGAVAGRVLFHGEKAGE